jgi:hypothetical protein
LECQLSERDATLAETRQDCRDNPDKAAGEQAWLRAEVEHKQWRASVLRLRFCVEARLRHVKQLRRQENNGKERLLGRRVSSLERRVAAVEGLLKGESGCLPTPSLDAS